MRRRTGLLHVMIAILLAGLTVFGTACGDDGETPTTEVQETGTITELAVATSDLSTLVSALETAGLAETLGGDGPFTVFAPTNAAFDKIDDAELQALLADKDALSKVLLTHVVDGKLSATDVAGSTTLTTLSGETLTVETNGTAVRVNGARITSVDIEASNGVIHLIDTVILEEETVDPQPGTIPEVATENGNFTTLLAAVDAAGLSDALSAAGPLTVFAPTDSAFAGLPDGTVEALLNDIPALTDILLTHVAEGRLDAAAVTSRGSLTMLSGVELEINSSGGATFIGGAEITATDIEASNGIIHVLGDVIVPEEETPGTIAEIAAGNDDFSTLVAALEAADLVDTLNDPDATFTVFAPTNSAFEGLPEGTVEALLADIPALTDILLSHVAEGELRAEDVLGSDSITMLSGVELAVTTEGDDAFIGGAIIAQVDIEADNGIIHVLGDVIVPGQTPGTIAEIAAGNDDFSTLVTALEAADLVDTLADPDGSFTVFAPTNMAFMGLPDGTLDALLNDIPALTDILLSHVAAGELRAEDVLGSDSITMLSGVELDVTTEGDDAFIGGALIAQVDIEADNGIIHVLGDVIVPEAEGDTIVDIAAGDERFGTLVTALEAADLVDTLADPDGNFTVFAPTDMAFGNLPDGTLDALLNDIPALTDILLAHVAAGRLSAEDVLGSASITMLSGVELAVTTEGDDAFIGGAMIMATDIEASNGIVHVLSDVILPPAQPDGTVVDIALGDTSFDTLVTALTAADLVETLNDPEATYTVFAPTNGAFDGLPEGTLEALLEDIPALTDILLAHVAEGELPAAMVLTMDEIDTLAGVKLDVVIDGETVLIGGAELIDTDIPATNGIVHVLGDVIVPEPTITDIAVGNDDFSTLVAALTAADLADTLNDREGEFTVFAPTNGAFANLPDGTLDALLNDIPALTDVLLTHVVAGTVLEADVAGLRRVETLSGAVLEVRIEEDGVFIGNAPIIDTDILAANGVVHVIGEVIVPERDALGTIADIAVGSDDFSTLVTALTEADLVDTLSDPDAEFTVFAPTNGAFANLPDGTLDALLNDIPALTDVLLTHVVAGAVFAEDVIGLRRVETLSGAVIEVRIEDQDVFVGNAPVIATDVPASNGVVHVIGEVIVPERDALGSIVDIAVGSDDFSTLVTALTEADLVDTLNDPEATYTVFAPTNAAFGNLPDGTLEALLADIPALTDILLAHVVEGELTAEDVLGSATITTLAGVELAVTTEGDDAFIGGAIITATDITASNGIVHVLGDVIVPE